MKEGEDNIMFKVYKVTSGACYTGYALVAANSAEEANKHIATFKNSDKDNTCDSWGYDKVYEDDRIEHLFSDEEGIIDYGISYSG